MRFPVKSVVLAAIACSMPTLAAEPETKPPPPVMEPDKLGPTTEVVDAKAYATVFYIAPGGSERGDGTSNAPFAKISQALSKTPSASAEKRIAVFVAAGEYKGETVKMKPFVDLYGGFDPKSWQRDIDANRSILDGEGQRRVVVGADNARIDGFVIRGGKVAGPGAAVLCEHTSPTISNNTIIKNATLEPVGAHKEMIHQHGNDGGAVACINGSKALVRNNIISGNTTELGNGGGVAAANWSQPSILNNVICNNVTGLKDDKDSRSSNGGGVSANTAAIRGARMAVNNNVIVRNYAGGNSDGGGIYCEYDSAPVIGANWILGNESEDDGDGVYIMKSSHPLFTSNIVAGHGGAIRLSKEGRADIEQNLMYGNGGALFSMAAWMNLKNNTIVDNGSGVGHANHYAPHLKPPVITENLIYGNRGQQFGTELKGEDAPIVTKNDIEGGYAAGKDNFDEKPQFVEDAISGEVQSIDYDEQRCLTTLAATTSDGAKLSGRVINVGGQWGVIKHAGEGKLLVWGDLRPKTGETKQFKIWSTYQLRTPLTGGVGAQASR